MMKNSARDRTSGSGNKTAVLWTAGIPAGLLLVIWPCLVHADRVRTGLEMQPWYPSLAETDDYFMHIRSWVLLLLALVMLAVMFGTMAAAYAERGHYRPVQAGLLRIPEVCLGLAGILTLVSAFFSKYRNFSFSGMTEQYETVWVLLAYGIVFFYFSWLVRRFHMEAFLLRSLLLGAFLQSLIGLSQLAGRDFWASRIGNALLFLGRGDGTSAQFVFANDSAHRVYLSFYHPNYAAVYLVMMLPMAIGGVFLAKRAWEKAARTGVVILLMACLKGTGSRTALLVLPIMVVLALLLMLRTKKYRLICLAVLLLGSIAAVFAATKSPEDSYLGKLRRDLLPERQTYHLRDIDVTGNDIRVVWDEHILFLCVEEDSGHMYFSLKDENGTELPITYDQETGSYRPEEREIAELSFDAQKGDGYILVIMYQNEIPWRFVKRDGDEHYIYISPYGKEDTIENAQAAFGDGYENGLSGRIYIWSRTVPLLKKHLLLGSGPDTFPLVFPQNDYIAKANIGPDMLMPILSRAHSFYLQTAVQLGVPALLLMLACLGVIVVRICKAAVKTDNSVVPETDNRNVSETDKRTAKRKMPLLFFVLSIAGFLLMGITNDSVVVVSPLFWAIAGLGYGCTCAAFN